MIIMEEELNPKLKKLIKTACDLFFRYGIKKVSIKEICREAKVSKMTFYKHFRNKDALAIYMLNEFFNATHHKFEQILALDIPFAQKIRQIDTRKRELTNVCGRKFIDELISEKHSECGKFLIKKRKESNKLIKKLYTDAQKNGEIRSDIKIEFILFMIDHFREIMLNETIKKLYPDTAELINELFNFLFYGISNKKPPTLK